MRMVALASAEEAADNASGYLACWRRAMRSRLLSCWRCALPMLAAAALCSSPALAQTPAEFYRGKSITMIVSSASGGGYDAISRVLANHLGRHIPGNPQVVVRNMACAGGIVATNHLYNVAA